MNNGRGRNRISFLIPWQVYPLLKGQVAQQHRWWCSPQHVKLMLLRCFSPKIRTGPYVWSRGVPKGGDQMTSAIERRSQKQESDDSWQGVSRSGPWKTRPFRWGRSQIRRKPVMRDRGELREKRVRETRGSWGQAGMVSQAAVRSWRTRTENWPLDLVNSSHCQPLRGPIWLEWYKWKTTWEALRG